MAEWQLSLTRRELAVLRQVAAGKTNTCIVEALGISEATLRVHLAAIGKKVETQLSESSLDDSQSAMPANGGSPAVQEPSAGQLMRNILRDRAMQPNHPAS